MRLGVDYSVRPAKYPTHADWEAFGNALLAKGRTFVGRYLASSPSRVDRDRRAITKLEAEVLQSMGISIFSWWENSPEHTSHATITRALRGFEAGRADAIDAYAMMGWLGAQDGAVFFTVDTDTTGPKVRAYFEGVGTIYPVEKLGVYGGYHVVKYLFDQGLVGLAAQTEAWSYLDGRWPKPPRWDRRAQLRQWTVHGSLDVCRIRCDGLEAHAGYFGQWDEEEDDMELEKLARVSEVADSYDKAADRALQMELIRVQGGDPTVADAILVKKAEAVRKVKVELGLIKEGE